MTFFFLFVESNCRSCRSLNPSVFSFNETSQIRGITSEHKNSCLMFVLRSLVARSIVSKDSGVTDHFDIGSFVGPGP